MTIPGKPRSSKQRIFLSYYVGEKNRILDHCGDNHSKMKHLAIQQVLQRATQSKSDSDFTYFFSLLYTAEALAKTIVAGMLASLNDDRDRNRYRLEYSLVRTDGLGDWARHLEDAVSGVASHYLLEEAKTIRTELTKTCKEGEWQYDATAALKAALSQLNIESEELPVKTDMMRWFRLFARLRNKTRAHGATVVSQTGEAAKHVANSLTIIIDNFSLLHCSWVYLYRNLSGKYRVSKIAGDCKEFEYLKSHNDENLADGVYVFMGTPRQVLLMESDPELQDFYFPNGGAKNKSYELLSYYTDSRRGGELSFFQTPPGQLPASETAGHGELLPRDKCLSNAPDRQPDYINRTELEFSLCKELLIHDRHPIVTLVGSGGIGKTSLALKVIHNLFDKEKYFSIVWLSARDVDLRPEGPKPVRATVLTIDDMAKFYSELVRDKQILKSKEFNHREFFEEQLQKCDTGPCLFVFDNFETMKNPNEVYNWIDTHIRSPNKALITTRLREAEFKGDYPVGVGGMRDSEAEELIKRTANILGIDNITDKYKRDLIDESEGHPYVIKILLGEVAKNKRLGNIRRMVAGTENILTALFERTYHALSPCAERAFLTLSAWNSAVPRLALEAVLIRSTKQRQEVEKGIDSLLQFSLADIHKASSDGQKFISLPLVAREFGKKKLNLKVERTEINADVEILQMLGTASLGEPKLGLDKKGLPQIKWVA